MDAIQIQFKFCDFFRPLSLSHFRLIDKIVAK